jgi:hypothetical protein
MACRQALNMQTHTLLLLLLNIVFLTKLHTAAFK